MEPILWAAVFGNDAPVEVEVGPGRGDVLLYNAAARPHHNFLGIEPLGADAIAAAAVARGLRNLRVVRADARCVIANLVPPVSVTAYHVYFPDPWPKNRHRPRRLFTDGFTADLTRTLRSDGVVHVATDVPALFAGICAALRGAGLLLDSSAEPPPRPVSKFERKYARAGTYYARFTR